MGESSSTHIPETYEREHIDGPLFHGTKSALEAAEKLMPGYSSNFQAGRVSNNIYFTALVQTAAWGGELATPSSAWASTTTAPAPPIWSAACR